MICLKIHFCDEYDDKMDFVLLCNAHLCFPCSHISYLSLPLHIPSAKYQMHVIFKGCEMRSRRLHKHIHINDIFTRKSEVGGMYFIYFFTKIKVTELYTGGSRIPEGAIAKKKLPLHLRWGWGCRNFSSKS